MADQSSSKRGIDVIIKHEDTELRLGLPGASTQSSLISASFTANKSKKRAFYETSAEESTSGYSTTHNNFDHEAPPPKAQIMGWPPIRSYRKNCFQAAAAKQKAESTEGGGTTGNGMKYYIKVSVDGAPYLRKIDLKLYKGYTELLKALEDITFKFKAAGSESAEREGWHLNGSEFVATYEDRDGDWMLVGDVPWEMFSSSCKRLRIMKGSIGC